MAKERKPRGKGMDNSFVRSISVDGVEYPVEVMLSLIKNRGKLKAIVRLNYFGMFLNDIRIIEDFQGNTIVLFPTREHLNKATNETVEFNVYVPSYKFRVPLNKLIVDCYQSVVAQEGPIVTLLKKDSIADDKPKQKKPATSRKKAAKPSSEETEPEVAEEIIEETAEEISSETVEAA